MSDFIFHKDGSITYWSVLNQVWERRMTEIPDAEYAGMHAKERAKCLNHFRQQEQEQEYKLFKIAFAKADGSWDVYETFFVYSECEANSYAEDNYSRHPDKDLRDWYVLDENNKNINGGE